MPPDTILSLPSPAEQYGIPSPGELPLPGPAWLFHALLLLTFVLHLVAMNLTLGGGLVVACAEGWRRRTGNEHAGRLAQGLAKTIPYTVAATITSGVAPLLFLQVLYGQFFYTSSILMAVPWFLVVVLLILAYYGFYRNATLAGSGRSLSLWIAWASAVFILLIGFFYTHNMTLMLTPEKWRAAYTPHGLRLAGVNVSMILRYLHFVVASVAVTGAFTVGYGLYVGARSEREGRWLVRFGGTLAVGATLVQFIGGFGFLFSLEERYRTAFLGGNGTATSLLMGSLLLGVVSMVCFVWATLANRPTFPAVAGMGVLFLTIVLMALVRDRLRFFALEPYLEPMPESPQVGVMAIFFVLLVAALATVSWMVTATVKSARRPA